MFSHIFLGVTDFERALGFYNAVLGGLGLEARFCDRSRPWAGWQSTGESRPLFLIGKPFDEKPHAHGNGQMVAFLAPTRALVDSTYEAALAHGGTSEGAPGLRPEYHVHYYGAYFRDPDGNKLCVACHAAGATQAQTAAELISKRIAELGGWRGEALGRMRRLIVQAEPGVVEEWKWMGTPVWSHDGIICTGESYKDKVKLTFAKGASLTDPGHLFNASLDGNVRRAIDIREGEEVDEAAFKALVRQAIALNSAGKSKPSKRAKP